MQLSRLSDISLVRLAVALAPVILVPWHASRTRCIREKYPLPLVTGGMEPRGVALRGVSYDSFCFHVQHPVMKRKTQAATVQFEVESNA